MATAADDCMDSVGDVAGPCLDMLSPCMESLPFHPKVSDTSISIVYLCMYVYVYIYVYMYIYMYICIYIYI